MLDVATYFNTIDRALMKAYAISLKGLMPGIVKEKCFGCEMRCDSQLDHNVCMMMGIDERLKHCLEDAVKRVDEKEVTAAFHSMMPLYKCLHHPSYMFTAAWRSQLWENEEWCDGVVAELLKLC